MSNQSAAERTEPATQQRKRKARKEGDLAKSQEVSGALAMLVVAGVISWWFASTVPEFIGTLRQAFKFEHWDSLTIERASEAIQSVGRQVFAIAMPVAAVTMVIGVLANLMQIGVMFNMSLVKPKGNRINPLNFFKRTFSMDFPISLIKSILKGMGVVAIAAYGLRDEPTRLWKLTFLPIEDFGLKLQGMAFTVFSRVAAALLVLALLDVLWTRFRHAKKLRMTKQEVKDEMKNAEGDPLIKMARRQRARELAMGRLSDNVKEATVVVTNPTHFAVALRYDHSKDPTPRVVAKGRGFKALKIRELAKKYEIPTVENRPLARTLYSSVRIGRTIPVELYRAVAQLLAKVYKQQQKARGR